MALYWKYTRSKLPRVYHPTWNRTFSATPVWAALQERWNCPKLYNAFPPSTKAMLRSGAASSTVPLLWWTIGCCSPGWEIELGALEGNIQYCRSFTRKSDHAVNGIANMETFEPSGRITIQHPTVQCYPMFDSIKTSRKEFWPQMSFWKNGYLRTIVLRSMRIWFEPQLTWLDTENLILQVSWDPRPSQWGGQSSQNTWRCQDFPQRCNLRRAAVGLGKVALSAVPIVCTDAGAWLWVVTDPLTGEHVKLVRLPPLAIHSHSAEYSWRFLFYWMSGLLLRKTKEGIMQNYLYGRPERKRSKSQGGCMRKPSNAAA
jgi:hypothetical protein